METMLAQINVGDGLGRLQPINTPHGDGNPHNSDHSPPSSPVATDQYPSRGWKLGTYTSQSKSMSSRCNRSIPLTGMETCTRELCCTHTGCTLQPINTPHGDGNDHNDMRHRARPFLVATDQYPSRGWKQIPNV